MSTRKAWTEEEQLFLNGVLKTHGDKPTKWTKEVKAMVKARLADRTESGIYQQTLTLIKARKIVETVDEPAQAKYKLMTGA